MLPPTPVKGTASAREQSPCRVPPTPVHAHVNCNIWGVLLLATYSHYSPAAFHVGHFSKGSMQIARIITY